MSINIKEAIDYFSRNPKQLFLLDGIGALFTTCSLYFVLSNYRDLFGMPLSSLTNLSIIGLVYCVYSLSCYFFLKDYWTIFLRIIGFSNLLYCILTLIYLYTYNNDLTTIGMMYFMGEIIIIISLVYIEFKGAEILKAKKISGKKFK